MADRSPQQTLMVNGNVTLPGEIAEVGDLSDCLQTENAKEITAADILQQALDEAEGFGQVTIACPDTEDDFIQNRIQPPSDHSYVHTVNTENVRIEADDIEDSQGIESRESTVENNDVSEKVIDFQNLGINCTNESLQIIESVQKEAEKMCLSNDVLSLSAMEESDNISEFVSSLTNDAPLQNDSIPTSCNINSISELNNNALDPECNTQSNEPTPSTTTAADNSLDMVRLKLLTKSTTAPLGSSENPIQIIQQGNTYHSTQILTQEQLQQIAHVLQQQQVTKAMQNGGKSVLYDQATNTRIVYRVIYPSELQSKSNAVENSSRSSSSRGLGASRGRGRPRKGWPKRSEEDEKGNPALSKEEREEKKKHRPRTRSGRISKPPSYMVKDYKRIHHLDFNEEPYDDSDGGYSDYQVSDEDHEKRLNRGLPPGVTTAKKRSYNCIACSKAYIGKGGLSRHYRLNPSHGSMPEREDVSTQDENSNSSLASSVLSNSGCANQGNVNFSSQVIRTEAEAVSQHHSPTFHEIAASRRKSKLKEIMKNYQDEELMETVLPRLAHVVTLWEFLLMKSERGKPAQPDVCDMFRHFESLLKRMQKVAQNCLLSTTSIDSSGKATINISNEEMAKALLISTGTYSVKNLRNSHNENRLITVNPNDICQNSRVVEGISSGDLDTPPLKKKRMHESETSVIEEPLSATLPDQILSDVVQEVEGLELPVEFDDGSELNDQDSSHLLSVSLGSGESHSDFASRTLFDLNSVSLSSNRLLQSAGNSTTVTPSSLSSGCLSAVDSSEALRTHNFMNSQAQLQNLQVRKVQLFGSTHQNFNSENVDSALQNYTVGNERLTEDNISAMMGQQIIVTDPNESEKQMIICDSDNSTINNPCSLQNISTEANVSVYCQGLQSSSTMNQNSNSVISLLNNGNIVDKAISIIECQSEDAQKDFVSQVVPNCLANSNEMTNEVLNSTNVSGTTANDSIHIPDCSNAMDVGSEGAYSNFNEVSNNDETPESLENAAVIRQLVLPDGQVIGVWSTVQDQTDKAYSEQFVQGYLPGNLIIVQNPDGSLQVPNNQAVSLETLQALVAADQTLVGQQEAEDNSQAQSM